ncbi:MAG: serine/threonine-protein kinase, partial [Acidobacteriota bacterium]
MKTAYHLRLFDLLEQAQGWPPSDRRRLAEAACAGGPVSAQELLAALDRVEQLSGFLESPAWSTETAPDPESATRSWIGREIGPYRILAMLGSGGMGQVFLAEQQEPRRQVALKLIRSESISDSAAERFRAEQRALARLNHPHVAQFIEAGVSQEGRPFFAMELVEGQPIDAYLEDEIPAFEERLALFLQVCAAVHHAHQKQIVHRDLKPSNVLVRPVDGRAVVKVIDFGIAEALDRPIAGAGVDDSGGVYGTPEFLSPESFDGDVDTRADIYALGALLYQLVCGISPFRRGQGTPADLVERIRRGEKEAASVAAARVNLPWAARIRGDLEAIIVRAMHPQRDRRYGSVVDLVADVRLFLGSRPVSVLEP